MTGQVYIWLDLFDVKHWSGDCRVLIEQQLDIGVSRMLTPTPLSIKCDHDCSMSACQQAKQRKMAEILDG